MSHYAVAVFEKPNGNTIEKLLAPYDENLSIPHYISRDEIIKKVRDDIESYEKTVYAEYLADPDAYVRDIKSPSHLKYITEEFPIKLKWTDEQCYQDGIKYYEEEDIMCDGSVFSTYNPNSKWDWYQVGGRFSCTIPLKDGSFTDTAHADEVDINYCDEDRYKERIRFWELYIDGKEPETEEDKNIINWCFYNKKYYTDRYDSAEDYASSSAEFSFYAALLPNGAWLEPGQMGWFAISDATPDEEKAWRKKARDILKEAQEKDWTITMVDCHI